MRTNDSKVKKEGEMCCKGIRGEEIGRKMCFFLFFWWGGGASTAASC